MLRTKTLFIFLFVFLVALIVPRVSYGAVLSLDPVTQSVAVNTPFTVNVNLDTKGENTTATDVLLTFDTTLLEITNVAFPSSPLYPTNTKIIDNVNGKLRLTGTEEDAVHSYNGSGTLATLTINPKSQATASLVFSCELGKSNESNVFKKGTSQDILECGSLVSGNYSIGTSTSPANTVTPTIAAGLPTSGNIGPTGLFLIGGTTLLGVGALLIFLL